MKKQIFYYEKKHSLKRIYANYKAGKRVENLLDKQLYVDKLSPFPLAIFANDHIGIYINEFGYYEKDELEIIFNFLKPLKKYFSKTISLDIGANIGNHSIFFSRYFNKVISFEPNDIVFQLLLFNTQFIKNIINLNQGLSDKNEKLFLRENKTNLGASNVVNDSNHKKITLNKLDNVKFDKEISFIKIDVEGFEQKVLAGGLRTIKLHKPIITFEQFNSEFKDGTSSSISILKKLGYKICWYQNGYRGKSFFIRRVQNIKDIFFGRKHMIYYDENVPPNSYSMLIAIPEKFHNLLNLI